MSRSVRLRQTSQCLLRPLARLVAVACIAAPLTGVVVAPAGAATAPGPTTHKVAYQCDTTKPGYGTNTTGGVYFDTVVGDTVEITMNDAMRFTPSSVSVRRNETIRFVLKNEGRLRHEMVLGRISDLKKHAALMIKFPDMQHSDPNQASVEPGQTGELVWRVTRSGNVDFACLQPGHYDAGMKGQVVVGQRAP